MIIIRNCCSTLIFFILIYLCLSTSFRLNQLFTGDDRLLDVASKMLLELSSNPSRPTMHASTSMVYKREATEHDPDYVKKYNEDLNTTLIFVRRSSCTSGNYLTCSRRQVCSPASAWPLSSMSIPTSNPIQTTNPWSSSVQFSSLSINQLSPVRPLPFHLSSKIHQTRSSW